MKETERKNKVIEDISKLPINKQISQRMKVKTTATLGSLPLP